MNKSTQKQVQPKVEQPHVGKPKKVMMLYIMERELPDDCKLSDHALVKHMYRTNHYGVAELLDELIEMCKEKEEDLNIPYTECQKYKAMREDAEAWNVESIFVG